MTTTLGEKLRSLAERLPERAVDLRRQADAFDGASHGYFFAEKQTIKAKDFVGAWQQARALYDELSELEPV
jgi:hypothetical protein